MKSFTRFNSQQQGQALAELAVVLPILLSLTLSLPFFLQLFDLKIRLLEAARWGVWERTLYGRQGARTFKPPRDPSQIDSSNGKIIRTLFLEEPTLFATYPADLVVRDYLEEDFALSSLSDLPFGLWDEELPSWGGPRDIVETILEAVETLGFSFCGTTSFHVALDPRDMHYVLPSPFSLLPRMLDLDSIGISAPFTAGGVLVPDPWKNLSLEQTQQVITDTWYFWEGVEENILRRLDDLTIDRPEVILNVTP